MSGGSTVPPPREPPPPPGPPQPGLGSPGAGGIGRAGIEAAKKRRLRFGLAALTIPTGRNRAGQEA